MSTLTVSNLKSPSSNVIDVFPGQVVYSPGSIVQIVQTVKTDTFSTGSNGTWIDVTGMSVTITPKKTSSKILLMVSLSAGGYQTTPKARLLRGSTVIAAGDTSGSKASAMMGTFYPVDQNQILTLTNHFMDSPATTSPTTYKIQVYNDNAVTIYVNRSTTDGDTATGSRLISVITAMEVAV